MRSRRCSVVTLLLVSITCLRATAQVAPLASGQRLPLLKGEFLTGRQAVLPDASLGQVTLVLVGFTYKSRTAVEAWAEWFRRTHGTVSDATCFEVPMIGGMARLGRRFITSGMRKGTPKELHERVLTVSGGIGDWKKRLEYSDRAAGDAYLLLIDRDGLVRRRWHGQFDQTAADELAKAIVALLSPVG